MYIPSAFKVDRSTSLEFASSHGFGLACAFDGTRPIASPLPFVLDYTRDGTPRLTCHVARGNPLAACADGRNWLIAVSGPHTYISPHWYASPDQVPTWLYQTVHLSGPARTLTQEELIENLERLSAKFEAWLKLLKPRPAWTMAEISPGRREMLLKAITGIAIAVDTVEGSFKLNQTKSEADAVSVADALAALDNADAQAIAGLLRARVSQPAK
jgi:transcriptional regulator